MSRRANPTKIGLFMIGAIILAVIGVATLTSAEWFEKRSTFISYFSESVNGLERGAPVKFQGVPVGSVTELLIQIDRERQDLPGTGPIRDRPHAPHVAGRDLRPPERSKRLAATDRGRAPGPAADGRAWSPTNSTSSSPTAPMRTSPSSHRDRPPIRRSRRHLRSWPRSGQRPAASWPMCCRSSSG